MKNESNGATGMMREGRTVMVIGAGDSKVIFNDSCIEYDPETEFRNIKKIGDTILEGIGSNRRVVDVRKNPDKKGLFRVVDKKDSFF